MALYIRDGGVYQQATRVYIKQNRVYIPVKQAYVRNAGTYKLAFDYDVNPPNPPEMLLQIIEHTNDRGTVTGRYIKVGVRLPGGANDPDARLVRVLTNYAGKAPTTQYGGTYTSGSDQNYTSEPWSEWRYNSYGPHKDTSVYAYKQWPRNATPETDITNDKDYFFTGWTLSSAGFWSVPTAAKIHVPKATVDAANVVVKEARFQPNTSGSWSNQTGFQTGKLLQQGSPKSQGIWLYGNQFTDSVGSQGTPTIRSATIKVKRLDDGGVANANVYLWWAAYANVGDLPAPASSITVNETTKLGTLAKGQSKDFNLPAAFYNNLDTQIHSMGLAFKDPVKATAFAEDYSEVESMADNLRCGEVHIVWEEKPR